MPGGRRVRLRLARAATYAVAAAAPLSDALPLVPTAALHLSL